MITDLSRFVEFGLDWTFGSDTTGQTRVNMVFEPITINTAYIAWARRYPISGGIEMTEIHMADRGGTFRIDAPYEEIKALMRS